jgi:predicted DsbA family dithiol-disulfide isomerase
LQSAKAEELLLLALRKAVMTNGRNISKERVLLSVAEEVSHAEPEQFSLGMFEDAWQNGSGVEAFKHNLQQTRFLKIGRYPTLTFTTTKARGIMITGYRPYEVLKEALDQILTEP